MTIEFRSLRKLLNNAKNLTQEDAERIAVISMSEREAKKLIIRLNTIDQLFEKGEDSRGIKLDTIGDGYSLSYKRRRRSLGLATDKIQLFLKGGWYAEFRIEAQEFYIQIIVDAKIGNFDLTQHLLKRFGKDVLGLSDESLQILIPEILPTYVEETRKRLLEGI